MELPDEQYPRIRATTLCPRCTATKDKGLVLCWTCNRKLKRANDGGYGEGQEMLLQSLERTLKSFGLPKWNGWEAK